MIFVCRRLPCIGLSPSRFFAVDSFRRYFGFSLIKSKMANKNEFHRLPKNVLPINYALKFKPDLNKFTFDGSAEISVEVIANNSQ